MIKPLSIRHHVFSSNLIQGPLAGVSCAPFRQLVWEYSHPAFTCTEMISCKTLMHQPKSSAPRLVSIDPREGPLCFQLSAADPKELGVGTRIATDCGATLIDLNCGCPVKKIRSKGAGSSLLSDASRIYQLIRAMKEHTTCPVGIKIRVDANSDDRFNEDIAKAVQDAEADFLTVHGRHWTQGYDIACSYEDIAFFVRNMHIPVIGNGDIACAGSLQRMLETGCAGAMIGRAGVGQPWLIDQLIANVQAKDFTPPSLSAIAAIFLKHVEGLITLLQSEKFAIIQARTFAKYYARSVPTRTLFCEDMNACTSLEDLRKILDIHFLIP